MPGRRQTADNRTALVEFVDIYPTLCELASLPIPKTLEGKSLAPLLTDASAKVKDAAFSQFPRNHEGRDYMGYAMRTGATVTSNGWSRTPARSSNANCTTTRVMRMKTKTSPAGPNTPGCSLI